MVKITINGTVYEVDPGKNLLQTCLALGFDIPYFCFHPALGSVGACRQCAVKKYANADDKKGRIVMSCMEPVVDGLIITTEDKEIKEFRAAVIESLMTNHPHDCPVCDEGGECHLQDMTVMTGHNYRRFDFKKRTFTNQDLGPYISHEMNRCIECYRCVRFYRDYAGGTDLDVYGSGNRVYFGRQTDGKLESQFSGNLVEICPTGVFTDKTLKEHYTRKWDLTNSPSICVNCSVGCNTIVSERYGSVRRIMSRYNGDVNGYFICDKGRFGYESLNSPSALQSPVTAQAGADPKEISGEALNALLSGALKGKKLAGLASPEASLESNFVLESLVGKENFYHGVTTNEYELTKIAIRLLESGRSHSPSLKEIEKSDAVFILGEDPAVTAPMMALSIRQASGNKSVEIAAKSGIPAWNNAPVREIAQNRFNPVFIATQSESWLDTMACDTIRDSVPGLAALGLAVASAIEGTSSKSQSAEAQKIAAALLNAANPVIITGLQCNDKGILEAVEKISLALEARKKKHSVSVVFPASNSLGLGLLDGKSIDALANAASKGEVETLIVLENDLFRIAGNENANAILGKCKNVIVLDHKLTETGRHASIVLSAGSHVASTGTIVNNEGRAQRYYRVLPENANVRDSWKYLLDMINIAGTASGKKMESFDDVMSALTASYPVFSAIKWIIPDSGAKFFNEKVSRQTARFSGRTSMNAAESVSEPQPPKDNDSPLAFSMEGYKGVTPSPYLTPYYWSPGWNSVQAMNKYMDEPGGTLKGGNPGVLLFGEKSGNEKSETR